LNRSLARRRLTYYVRFKTSETNMNTEDLNALHGNPDNWHLVFFYFAPEDPRIVVKKRLGIMGWTLNFARPMAIPFLASLIASAYAYMNVLSQIGLSDSGKWMGVLLLIILIVSLCGWMSNPRRFTNKSEQVVPPNGP
jgi:hypothetical protein